MKTLFLFNVLVENKQAFFRAVCGCLPHEQDIRVAVVQYLCWSLLLKNGVVGLNLVYLCYERGEVRICLFPMLRSGFYHMEPF